MNRKLGRNGGRASVYSVVIVISALGGANAWGQTPTVPWSPPATTTPAPATPPETIPVAAPAPTVAPTSESTSTQTVPAITPNNAPSGTEPPKDVAPAQTPAPTPVTAPVTVVPVTRPRVITVVSSPVETPPVPRKTRYPFGLFLDFSPLWQTSRAFDLFSNRDLSLRTGLTIEADLLEVDEGTYLSVDLNGSFENASDVVLGNFDTELSVANIAGGLRLRKEFWSVVGAHVIALGGASHIETRFDEGRESDAWVPTAQLGAGLSGMLPNSKRVQPGLLVEGGYFLSGSTDLTLKSSVIDGALAQQTTALGSVERSGPYLRFSIFARY